MDNNFDNVLNNAIKRCEGMIIYDEAFKKGFHNIYPFATENIAGHIDEFDLNNKSLLTVGSSGDQVLNAILKGCKDVTVLDINPYAKYYYYLKVAGILNLKLEEFFYFFRFKDFPRVFKDNNDVFNKEIYNKFKSTLRLLDYESYLFWDELFQTFKPIDIRNNLFSHDENRTNVIIKCNPYLKYEVSYRVTRRNIKNANVNFIIDDLKKINLDRNFDNIWLSNVGTYLSRHFVKIMVDKYTKLLKNDGKLLISYLYKTTIDTKYKKDWQPIYNIEKTFEILNEYDPKLISFFGIDALKFNDGNQKDSILVYCKK